MFIKIGKLIIPFLCIQFCFSCHSKLILGKYITNYDYNNDVIILNNDSTFSYTVNSDIMGRTIAKGIWKIEYDTLYTHVLSPFDSKKLFKEDLIIEKYNQSRNSQEHVFKIFAGEKLGSSIVFDVYLDNDTIPIESNDTIFFTNKQFNTFRITYPYMKDKIFHIKNNKTNEIIACLYDDLFIPVNYLSIPEKFFISKKNTLIPIRRNGQLGVNTRYTLFRSRF